MSAIIRQPGGQVVPYDRIDDLATRSPTAPPAASGGALLDALTAIAEPLRDYYCQVAPTAPINDPNFSYLRSPSSLSAAVNRAICANSANPLPPARGQCNCVVYQHYAVVFGFDNNGLPKRSVVTPGNRVFGVIAAARVVPSGASSSRWQVEVLCRGGAPSGSTCNPNTPLTWEVIGSTETGFNRPFGASVEQYYAIRVDGQPDNCAIAPSPIPLPSPGSQVIVLPRTNPVIQRFFDVDIPVTIQERGRPLSLDLQLPDVTIQVDFGLDGVTFNLPGSDIDLDIGGISQQIQNTENNLSIEIENQISNQNNFIQESQENLSIELRNDFSLELEQQLGSLTVEAEVDFSPVLIQLDLIESLVSDPVECQETDLSPILEKLEELDEKYSERLAQLEESVLDAIQDAVKLLECYLLELIRRNPVLVPDTISELGSFTSSQDNTVTSLSVPTSALAVGVVVTGYDSRFVRVYKLDDDPMQVEAGFGHISLVSFNGILQFQLLATRNQTMGIVPGSSVSGLRLSLKPGVSVRAFAVLPAPQETLECESE